MKKFLSIAAVLALVFALAVPAFATDSPHGGAVSMGNNDSITVTNSSTGAEEILTLVITDSSETPDASAIPSGYKVKAVKEVNLVSNVSGEVHDFSVYDIDSLTILFGDTYDKLLHKTDGSWQDSSNTVTSLSPFALLVKDSAAGGGSGSGAKKSPQTGSNAALWAISSAAMVVCAGVCFSARKKVTE